MAASCAHETPSNLILLIAVYVLLAVLPLWLVQKPAPAADGKQVEIFAGADDQARDLIGTIAPDYRQWFEPLLEPASGEIASPLFACRRRSALASSATTWVFR